MDSKDLRHMYTNEYYLYHAAGHEYHRSGKTEIRLFTNIFRALSLALRPNLRKVTDIGSGRGELAKHLLNQGVEVTLVDYSPAAIELATNSIGHHENARFLCIDASDLGKYLPSRSQEAIFMTDFVEHVNSAELTKIFAVCAEVLREDGMLIIHTPEKTFGTVVTQAAVEPKHINLMDADVLRQSLEAHFGYAEAFTWNGTNRFAEPGRCIELFAIASPKKCVREHELGFEEEMVLQVSESLPGWQELVICSGLQLRKPFFLHLDCQTAGDPGVAELQLLLRTDRAENFYWLPLSGNAMSLGDNSLFVSSRMFIGIDASQQVAIREIAVRGKSLRSGKSTISFRGGRMETWRG